MCSHSWNFNLATTSIPQSLPRPEMCLKLWPETSTGGPSGARVRPMMWSVSWKSTSLMITCPKSHCWSKQSTGLETSLWSRKQRPWVDADYFTTCSFGFGLRKGFFSYCFWRIQWFANPKAKGAQQPHCKAGSWLVETGKCSCLHLWSHLSACSRLSDPNCKEWFVEGSRVIATALAPTNPNCPTCCRSKVCGARLCSQCLSTGHATEGNLAR